MTKNRIIEKKTKQARKPENKDLPRRRKSEILPSGLYYFEDDLEIENALAGDVITCDAWLLEFMKLDAGAVSFSVGEEEIRPPFAQLAIFYTPFSITRLCLRKTKGNLKGIAGSAALPAEFTKRPFVFECGFEKSPKSVEEVVEILRSARGARFVDAYPNASMLSLRAKRLIDENYRIFPSIARIAARLEVSHEHLTRQFKRDFCLTPNAYLHSLRIADASFRLTRGEPIIEVSGEVGYNDLSRFYKQFRKSTDYSPGVCQSLQKD